MNYLATLSKTVQSANLLKLVMSVFFVLGTVFSVFSQSAVVGVVSDLNAKEPLMGATILVKGTSQGAVTDFDGKYTLTIAPGTYTLVVQSLSYDKKTIPNVVVKTGQLTHLDVQLQDMSLTLDNVVVVAKANRESENVLLIEMKQAVAAKQAIGAKEMSRKGISDAESAVSQVSGISKQEGVKNVFVRGLGDRYNSTTFNGFPIPSEDPEYKNISLDFFGSDVIKNIGVSKVFSGDNYSDVAGAVIDISSKELVGEKELSVDFSCGSNTSVLDADFLKIDGVDYLGKANSIQPGDQYKTIYNYGNSLDPTKVDVPLNYSYGVSLGKKYKLGKKANPLSFFLVGSYSSSYSYTKENIYDTQDNGGIIEDMIGSKSSQNINQLVLGNLNYLTSKNEFSYNFIMIHDNNQSVGQYVGWGSDYESSLQPDEYENYGFKTRQQINDNMLIINQLISKIKISNRFKLDAGAAYNSVKGTEPDRRVDKLYKQSATTYALLAGDGAHIRNFSELIETDINGKLKLSYILPMKFKDDISSVYIGYDGRFIEDDFEANEYSMTVMGLAGAKTLDALTLDDWFNQANYDNDDFYGARRYSNYQVSKQINSGYATVDYQFSPKIILNLGLRADVVNLKVNYDVKGGFNGIGEVPLDKFYYLPSMNLKYNVNNKNALRVGLSKTYTLPQSKEISPYQYIGPSFKSQGNPDLQPSDNYNADLKWDYDLSPSELISVTAFYKYIQQPIARAYTPNGAGYFTYQNISEYATVAGIELEVRKNIFNNTNSDVQKENKLSTGLNASYIYSNMLIDISGSPTKESQLEGASPIIFNVDLSYNYSLKDLSLTNSFVLNYSSDRIYTIGLAGFKDVMETGVPTLDFVSISDINKHFSIKLKVKNILDPTFKLTRESNDASLNQVLNSYNKGMSFNLGLSYKL